MALRVTNWDYVKILLFICDLFLIILNIGLLILISYIIYNEYYGRGTLKLFITPFLISIVNISIDILMNKKNITMKYAGHNRYGMITRFFMFYFIMTIIIYSHQRCRYIIKIGIDDAKYYVILFGFFDMGFLLLSMILSFFVIDVQSFKQILVRKKRKKTQVTIEKVNSLQNIEIIDMP